MMKHLLAIACFVALTPTSGWGQQLFLDANTEVTPTKGSNPTNFANFGDSVLFRASSELFSTELWRVTEGGDATLVAASVNSKIVDLGNRTALFFSQSEGSGQLWKTDGTAAGTTVVTNAIEPALFPDPVGLPGLAFFARYDFGSLAGSSDRAHDGASPSRLAH